MTPSRIGFVAATELYYLAGKANLLQRVYMAFNAAREDAGKLGSLEVPLHLRNAPTRLMKDIGYGKDYQYDPDTPEGFSGQDYFPDEMERQTFYRPKGEGAEARIKERLERWAALRKERGQ